jgi:hypothetical protein
MEGVSEMASARESACEPAAVEATRGNGIGGRGEHRGGRARATQLEESAFPALAPNPPLSLRRYYLYNWRCRDMRPQDVGLVLL